MGYLTLQKQVGCFNHRVVTLVAENWRDSGYESFTLVLKSNCIRQPKMPLSSSSYNHNTLTALRTSVRESPACIRSMNYNCTSKLLYTAVVIHAPNASR